MRCSTWLLAVGCLVAVGPVAAEEGASRPHVAVRGIYGGVPTTLMEDGRTLAASGVNAVWLGERAVTKERVRSLKAQGARVFAEFNTLHRKDGLAMFPDAEPRGPDMRRSPPPHDWQGICPTHERYRAWRMNAFKKLLEDHDLDGVWLDYHHAHASWERADPVLPDTCFCFRCIQRFLDETPEVGRPGDTYGEVARLLLTKHREAWTRWRCGVFTDWVRELREILDATRPGALLGTFHCPWTDEERDGALREKLAIDLRAQMRYLDVFSPMPYHARFGHATDPAWISRQTAWLGRYLGIEGRPGERVRIWPIVQLSDWGETVPLEQVGPVIDHGTRSPATGVLVFAWGSLRKQPEKVEALRTAYRALGGEGTRRDAGSRSR